MTSHNAASISRTFSASSGGNADRYAAQGIDFGGHAGLTALGYSVAGAQAALRALPPEEMPVEEKIRASLRNLAKI